MSLPIKTVAAITITLFVIGGVALLMTTYSGEAGSEVGDTSQDAGEGLDCVMANPNNAQDCQSNITPSSGYGRVNALDELFI